MAELVGAAAPGFTLPDASGQRFGGCPVATPLRAAILTPMRRYLVLALKVLGAVLLVALLVASGLYVYGRRYPIHSLYAEPGALPGDPLADPHATALALVERMTLAEKIDQLGGEPRWSAFAKFAGGFAGRDVPRFPHIFVGGNDDLGIPPWCLSDGPRGARVLGRGVEAVTTFPVAMARGASWDVDLERRVHEVIAREIRANGANYAATPCINLLRHPGWGRAQETYGEDPWHLGSMGLAAVEGIESQRVMACPKHYALNSVENSRWVIDVDVDERTLREVYLPHFRRVVEQGRPASIMSAYNKVRGDFAGESELLLTGILRGDWGFDGFVTTDWFYGLYDAVGGIDAGLNVEMPAQWVYDEDVLAEAVDDGRLAETQIDCLVVQSLRTRLPYALVEEAYRFTPEVILADEHVALARRAAEESMVLLENEEDVLPLQAGGGQTIAVIGRLADAPNTGDRGSSDAHPPYVVTPYAGLRDYLRPRGDSVILYDGADPAEAYAIAEDADAVIVVVGYTAADEGEYIVSSRDAMVASAEAGRLVGARGEGGDRESLAPVAADRALLEALADANPRTAIVYVGGSAIDLSAYAADYPAILYAWYGGMEGGTALARVLYGEVNPSGKLPFTVAADSTHYPPFTPYAEAIDYGYYHGYTLLDERGLTPAYPFGHGLSYTDFAYAKLAVDDGGLARGDSLRVRVEVTNTGERAGAEVVQLYVGFAGSAVERPEKLLRGFTKVALAAGASRTVELAVARADLAYYDADAGAWAVEAMEHEVYVGGSSARERLLSATFDVPPRK